MEGWKLAGHLQSFFTLPDMLGKKNQIAQTVQASNSLGQTVEEEEMLLKFLTVLSDLLQYST